jgi:hypothetical protein
VTDKTVCAASGPMTLAQLDPSAQALCTRTTLTFSCDIGSLLALRDQLIGNIVQVCTDDLRLRPTPKTSLPIRLIRAAFQPAAAAPRVSHVWQAISQS